MAQDDELKRYGKGSGSNGDDAYEDVDAEGDFLESWNLRNTGSQGQDLGYNTNIESLTLLSGSLLPGINDIIGGGKFDDISSVLAFRYNSAGNNQILLYNSVTNTYKVIFTDITDSNGIPILPLNPQNTVLAILINKTYAVWWAKDLEVGYCNLNTLASGGYGTVLPEDLSLLKPQCPYPPTGTYGSDPGQPANYWYGNMPQFIVQYVNADYNHSAWSTRSKRIVPYQENTPTLGNDVGQNNYIIIGVNIGSIRATTVNIGRNIGGQTDFSIIKSVDRSYIIALPNTAVNVSTLIFEAYNPTTNIYYYVSYGNEIPIPIDPNETDLLYDDIWPANAAEKINGNIIGLGDWKLLYARPSTQVSAVAVGYNPNIAIPSGTYSNPLTDRGNLPGSSGSGAGNHKRIIQVFLSGSPNTGDTIVLITYDLRNASVTNNYTYVVPSGQAGNLLAVVQSIAQTLPSASIQSYGSGLYGIKFIGQPYYELQTFSVELYFAGASVANSIPTVLDNTSYQLAIEWFDGKIRPFPLDTNNNYIVNTPSYAQVQGQAIKITLTIPSAIVPAGAVYCQVVITKPPVIKVLDVLGIVLAYKGTWDARSNTPGLAINSGDIGDTYQITTPDSPTQDVSGYTNLGNFATYNTGDYVTNVGGSSSVGFGQTYAVLQKTFADIAGNAVLCLSLNTLFLFNTDYAQEGVNTILAYDYAVGDRCTFHYWIDDTGNIHYFNNPCINLAVLGYDPGTYIVKVEKSNALTYSGGNLFYNGQQINARNIFFRLYSPTQANQATSAVQSTTEWFEIGDQILINNGLLESTTIDLFDGGAYYKTRQYADGKLPYHNTPVQVLATDLNYSDFYPSQYYSFGRARTYYDVLEQTERRANIITSQNYIEGSKNNGLNRFYPANIYGDGDGQISSSQGAIQIMWQRGDVLVCIQELNTFYIPVNMAYTILNDQLTGQSISEKLLNNGRYATENIGIGTAKESFWRRYNRAGFIDPFKSEPYELTLSGIDSISGKRSKYFKSTLNAAYQLGKKLYQFYNDFYEEVLVCIQTPAGILILFPFSPDNWNPNDGYTIVPSDVSATANGANCTASYDATTGLVTYTPTLNYVGGDSAIFTFNPGTGAVTKNNCLNWTAGVTAVSEFSFAPQINVPKSTSIPSNVIGVFGNNVPVAISIVGGEYSINGGAFTSSPGIVNQYDAVQVQQTSSAANDTETGATLSIGTPPTTAIFDITTGTTAVNPFTLNPLTGQLLNTNVISNSITVVGNTLPASISITGGSYSKNGGSYTTSPGTVNAGDIVTVKTESSASYDTLTSSTLTVDMQSSTFNVTTQYVDAFSFTPQTGVAFSTEIISNTNTVSGVSATPVAISITGGNYSVNGGAYTSLPGTVSIGDTVKVQVMSSASGDALTSCTLTILNQSGTFDVTTALYQNVAINANYRKMGCPSGQSGTFVYVSIPAGAYTSIISQADADSQAQAAAQSEANAAGTCLIDATISTVLVDYLTDVNADLCCFVQTAGLSETGQIVTGTIESPSGPLLQPNNGTDPSNCFLLSSDKLGTTAPGWRFGINTAYFTAKYGGTSLLSVTLRIQGRDTVGGVCNFSYGARPITQGYLELNGTTGARIPAVSAGTTTPVGVSSHITSGADGTVGTGVGSPVLDIIYTFAVGITPDSITTTTY